MSGSRPRPPSTTARIERDEIFLGSLTHSALVEHDPRIRIHSTPQRDARPPAHRAGKKSRQAGRSPIRNAAAYPICAAIRRKGAVRVRAARYAPASPRARGDVAGVAKRLAAAAIELRHPLRYEGGSTAATGGAGRCVHPGTSTALLMRSRLRRYNQPDGRRNDL